MTISASHELADQQASLYWLQGVESEAQVGRAWIGRV